MKNFRESTIEAAKAMGITARELGCETDHKLIKAFNDVINGFELNKSEVRTYVPEEYWEMLNIMKKKYKIVNVTYKKIVTKTVQVVMPEDESDYNATDYVSDRDIDYSEGDEDEGEWEYDDYDLEEDDMTKDDVMESGYEIVNDIDDFED